MNNSETDSDREGEPFIYDDHNNVAFPRMIRRRSESNHHLMVLNNSIFLFNQRQLSRSALKTGFKALKDAFPPECEDGADACFHITIYLVVLFFTANINYHLFSVIF